MNVTHSTSPMRRGSMFVEAVIALTVALIAMGATAQLIGVLVRQRRELEQTRIATNEAANVMERLWRSSSSELSDRTADWPGISQGAIDGLNDPHIRVSIETTGDTIVMKRCRVEVSWIDMSGERVKPIQLTAWKHAARTP